MSFSLFLSGILPPDGFYVLYLMFLAHGESPDHFTGDVYAAAAKTLKQSIWEGFLSLSSSIRLLSGPLGLVCPGWAERQGLKKWF